MCINIFYFIKCNKSNCFTNLSSPRSPLSMACGRLERSRSCVMEGEPRHSVDRRLITVEILGLDFTSGVTVTLPGVLASEVLAPESEIYIQDVEQWTIYMASYDYWTKIK